MLLRGEELPSQKWSLWVRRQYMLTWDLGVFSLRKRCLSIALIAIYNYLKRVCSEVGPGLFFQVKSNKTRGNGLYLCQGRLRLGMRKTFFTGSMSRHWNRLTWELVESSSLDCSKDMCMWHLGTWIGGKHRGSWLDNWTWWSQRSFPTLMIVWQLGKIKYISSENSHSSTFHGSTSAMGAGLVKEKKTLQRKKTHTCFIRNHILKYMGYPASWLHLQVSTDSPLLDTCFTTRIKKEDQGEQQHTVTIQQLLTH